MLEESAVDCKLVVGWRAYLAQGTLVAIVMIALLIKRWGLRVGVSWDVC